MKNVGFRGAALGGGIFATYSILSDWLRHHDEGNTRPRFFDHLLVSTVIGTGLGAMYFVKPFNIFLSGFWTAMLFVPISWMYKNVASHNFMSKPNIFYENGTTTSEIDRFRH